MTVFPALQVSPALCSAPIQRGELHLLKAHFRMIPSIEFSDFSFVQLVEFPFDLQASVEVGAETDLVISKPDSLSFCLALTSKEVIREHS